MRELLHIILLQSPLCLKKGIRDGENGDTPAIAARSHALRARSEILFLESRVLILIEGDDGDGYMNNSHVAAQNNADACLDI